MFKDIYERSLNYQGVFIVTTAYWCVLVMILFPYIFTSLAKSRKDFNNHDPRDYLQKTTGWRRRAHYVQLNSFESTPAFGIAVIIAQLAHTSQGWVDNLAIAFVIARIIYAICYLTDMAALRTLVWMVGMACVVGLFWVAGAGV
jgi:uncharacterized MAPEG superfamily protein